MNNRWRQRASRVSAGGVVHDPWNISTLSAGSFTSFSAPHSFLPQDWDYLTTWYS